MKKNILIILALIVVVAGGIMAWWYDKNERIQARMPHYESFDILSHLSKQAEDESVCEDPDYLEWEEFFWEGPDGEDEYIGQIISRDILPYYEGGTLDAINLGFITHITHPSYAMYISNRESLEDVAASGRFFLNHIFSYTGRKNDLLLSMYGRFRGTIFSILSAEDFHELGMPRLIRDLNMAYGYYEEDGVLNTDLLRDTYKALCGKSDEEVEFPSLPTDEDDEEMREDFWAHSFWARRYAENNMDAVREILNDLWAHYMEGSETMVDRASIHEDSLTTDENGNYIYQEYDNDGKLNYSYAFDRNGKRTGRWICYTEEGIDEECVMENGMMKEHTEHYQEGKYRKSLFDNDVLLSSSFYKENNALYKTISYDWSDGKLTEFIRHWDYNADGDTIIRKRINGKTEGPYIVKYAGGNLKTVANYSDDLLDGEHKTYYPNGQLHNHTYFEKGRYSGTFLSYYDSGEIKQKGTFENGQLEGDYFFYEKNGEVEVAQYKAGKKVSDNQPVKQ